MKTAEELGLEVGQVRVLREMIQRELKKEQNMDVVMDLLKVEK